MQSGVIVIIQAVIFCILDAFIFFKVKGGTVVTRSKRAFSQLALTCVILQLITVFVYSEAVVRMPFSDFFNYSSSVLLFTAHTLSAFFWFNYLRFSMPKSAQFNSLQRILMVIPLLIIAITSVSSYWTHWIFYFDGNVYQRGSLAFLQIGCPIMYMVYAIAMVLIEFTRGDKNAVRKNLRNMLLLPIPALTGGALQMLFNIDGGFAQLGISVGMILIYLNMYLEEIHETEKILVQKSQLEKLQAQYDMVRALGSSYISIHVVNFEDGSIQKLNASREFREMEIVSNNAKDIFNIFILKKVSPDFRQVMSNFVDFSTLSQRLADKASTFMDYLSLVQKGWCRASWFVLSRNDQGAITKAIFTLSFVDQEIKAEKEHESIIRTLASQFQSLYLINMKDYSFTEIAKLSDKVRNIIGTKGSDARIQFDLMIKHLVVPASQAAIRPFVNLDTINERLKGKDFISQQFEGNIRGWAEGHFIVLERDENGDVSQLIWCTRGIAEEKKKELEYEKKLTDVIRLQQRDLNILSTLAQAYMVVYYLDINNSTFHEINPAAIQSVKDVIGHKGNAREKFVEMSKHLVAPEYKDATLEFTNLDTLTERLRDKQTLQFTFLGVHKHWFVGEFIVVNRDKDGNCTHVLWAIRSIQAQKEKDELHKRELQQALTLAESANRAKTVFLNNMSHDIRTPMNAILGFTQLLKQEHDNPEMVMDYLQKMESAGEYLLTIINNILDMARIESGKVTLDEGFMNLLEQEDNAGFIFEEDVKRKNLTFNVVRDIEHPYVMGDATKLKEIASNLLSNAVKYTPEGGTITMEMHERKSAREGYATYVMIVSDTGIGMSDEFKEHIFESFSRERNTTESKIIGTGLGMSIVKKLVDFLGGTIEVESQLGKGSKFTVTMEHKIVSNPEAYLNKHQNDEADARCLQGKRILLAEDNELNAEIAMAILADIGLNVEHAKDGCACVEMISNATAGHYDLILMDIQMPNMNGYEATRITRKMEDRQKSTIPILAMTANAFEEDKKSALDAGMNGHLAKPINVQALTRELISFFHPNGRHGDKNTVNCSQ